jgi:hypothetical protein
LEQNSRRLQAGYQPQHALRKNQKIPNFKTDIALTSALKCPDPADLTFLRPKIERQPTYLNYTNSIAAFDWVSDYRTLFGMPGHTSLLRVRLTAVYGHPL